MKEWLQDIGLDGPSIVAGFGGGIVRVIFDAKTRPMEVVGALGAGALTANYLGGPIAEMLHMPPLGTAFIVGFGGLQIAGMLFGIVRQKIIAPTQAPEQKGPANVA
jgi:hypothetical protein